MRCVVKSKFIKIIIFIFSIIIIILVVNSIKSIDDTKMQGPIENINMIYKEYSHDKFIIPENIIKFDKNNIYKIYWEKDFESYQIKVCLDKKDSLNIIYIKDGRYYSICQQSNWTNGDIYAYENTEVDTLIKESKNILGYTVVKVIVPIGSASNYIFYIIVSSKEPSLLLSDSISGEFSEFDINDDGQKELIAFDEYMYFSINNKLYKATYDYDRKLIKQVYFDEKSKDFRVYFSDGTNKIYDYDIKHKCLKKHSN